MLLFFFKVDEMVLAVFMRVSYALFVASFYCYLGSFILSSNYSPFRIFAFGGVANNLGLILGWCFELLIYRLQLGNISSVFIMSFLYTLFFASIFLLPMIRKNLFGLQKLETQETAYDKPDIISSVQERCHFLSDAFLLSSREEEILVLLERGKSLRLIEDEMVLSNKHNKKHVIIFIISSAYYEI